MPVAYKVKLENGLSSTEPLKQNLEAGRLDTFSNRWPHPDNALCSRQRMAKSGFYYTGEKDRVKCFVCRIKLEDWNPEEDEPLQKHLETSPSCQFAKIGKEEGEMTVEEWLDVFCGQAIHTMESRFNSLQQNLCKPDSR